jgi:hypothetical protein
MPRSLIWVKVDGQRRIRACVLKGQSGLYWRSPCWWVWRRPPLRGRAVSPWTPSLRTPENTGGTLAKYARLVRSQLVPPARHPLPVNDHAITHHRPKRHWGQVGAAISAVLFVGFGVGCGGSLFAGRCIVARRGPFAPHAITHVPGCLRGRNHLLRVET